jgi:hypothetical protein
VACLRWLSVHQKEVLHPSLDVLHLQKPVVSCAHNKADSLAVRVDIYALLGTAGTINDAITDYVCLHRQQLRPL